jgi:hypothetical protein
MKKLFLLIFLTSCTSSSSLYKNNFQNLDFKKNLNFDEFKKHITEYAKITPYPNID